tara:strand:+ start:5668 stop:5886 length:219 start_codon:yes stop_codon:yes gene_type:complete
MKYKAKETYKDAKNKHFQFGTQKTLMRGGTIEMDKATYKALPKSVRDELEPLETITKKVSKKKDTTKTEGDK